ncbi:hypothetical protein GCM10027613_37280 [Microlunatus endophyticus]
MNGVYCQVSTNTTVMPGKSVFQATGGMCTRPKAQLIMPTLASSSDHFQISADAAGITRNGVINNVLATARPGNFRSSSMASSRPSTSETITEDPTITTVFSNAGKKAPLVTTAA